MRGFPMGNSHQPFREEGRYSGPQAEGYLQLELELVLL